MQCQLTCVLSLAVVAVAASGAADLTAQRITVDENVHVSRANAAAPHYEIHLAADPGDSQRLLGGTMVWDVERGEYDVLAYLTTDHGKNWRPTLEIQREGSSMDPAVAFGLDNAAYMAEFGYDAESNSEMLVHRSADGGRTWLEPTEVYGMDREFLTVDRSGGDHHGRLYMNGTRGVRRIDGDGRVSGLSVIHSDDGGANFRGPTTVVSSGEHYVLGMSNGAVLSDGSLVILFGERRNREDISPREGIPTNPNAWLKAVRSEDGAETFEKAAIISDWYMRFGAGATAMTPSLAADGGKGPFRDHLYAAWADFRSGRAEILLARSADGGETWQGPVLVSDDRPNANGDGPDNFMPVVAVNDAGIVGVMWYDRRENPDNVGWTVRFAASLDGGETFLPSVRVSEQGFDFQRTQGLVVMGSSQGGGHPSEHFRGGPLRAEVTLHHFNNKGGDTAGMAADAGGVFHPFWIDNRTGVPQVWTAAVRVSGDVVPNGFHGLAELEDLSEQVTLDLSDYRYDPETGRVSVLARIVNTSENTLVAPLFVRVLNLTSEYGFPEVRGADQGGGGPGAVWEFHSSLEEGRLGPDETSAGRRLDFELLETRSLTDPSGYPLGRGGYQILGLEVKVLGRTISRH